LISGSHTPDLTITPFSYTHTLSLSLAPDGSKGCGSEVNVNVQGNSTGVNWLTSKSVYSGNKNGTSFFNALQTCLLMSGGNNLAKIYFTAKLKDGSFYRADSSDLANEPAQFLIISNPWTGEVLEAVKSLLDILLEFFGGIFRFLVAVSMLVFQNLINMGQLFDFIALFFSFKIGVCGGVIIKSGV